MSFRKCCYICLFFAVTAIVIYFIFSSNFRCVLSSSYNAEQSIHHNWDDRNLSELNLVMKTLLSHSRIDANSSGLVNVIRKYFILPPSGRMVKMSMPLFKTPQADAVDKYLKKRNGFFVECGSLDGERSSNTIWLEQQKAWNGLLVEMDPSWFMQLRGKNRKAYAINSCLSPSGKFTKEQFMEHKYGEGQLLGQVYKVDGIQSVYCFPFESIMLAVGISHVDYFSLDVEGFEYEILQSIPFDRISISVLSVEYKNSKVPKRKFIDFMAAKGYSMKADLEVYKPSIYFGCKDFIFVKN